MMSALLWCGLGLALLVVAGDKVVDFAASLATKARVSPAVVALTVVAAGTSFPELFVSAMATWDGAGAIAVGNVLGSNTFNIGFILGLVALIAPIPTTAQVLRVDWPFLAIASLGAGLLLRDGAIDRAEAAFLVTSCAAFMGFSVWYARRAAPSDAELVAHEVDAHAEARPTWMLVAGLLIGFAVLGLGARWFVDGAVGIARTVGLSERVIGLTIVSMGTGAPEVVASLVAVRKGRHDMAVANVIGSNVFNLLGILGVAGLVRPLEVPSMTVDVGVMLGFTVALGPLLWRQSRITRGEGGVMLAAYLAYTAWLVSGA